MSDYISPKFCKRCKEPESLCRCSVRPNITSIEAEREHFREEGMGHNAAICDLAILYLQMLKPELKTVAPSEGGSAPAPRGGTPRTDAAWNDCIEQGGIHEPFHGPLMAVSRQLERELAEALRLVCPGNGDDPEPVRCQSFEASEQSQPCPPGCCVMADEKDVRSILAAIEEEEGSAPSASGAPCWIPVTAQEVMESEGTILWLQPHVKAVAKHVGQNEEVMCWLPSLDRTAER